MESSKENTKKGRPPVDPGLFAKYHETKNAELRNQLVEKHLYMVDILIRRYLGKGIEYDDLYQVGAIALIKAVDRFEPTRGFTFASFATPTIVGEIKKHFRDKGWAIKVPRRVKEIAGAIPRVKESLTNKLGRIPTAKEVAAEMSITEKEVLLGMEASLAYGTFSISQTFNDSGEEGENLVFEKYIATEEKGFSQIEDQEIIEGTVATLSDTNKYIFKKRFIEGLSQVEIAEELGVSQMTISRAEKAIRKQFEKALRANQRGN